MHQFIIQSEISRRERERKKERKKRWVFHETSVYTHIVALLHASHRLSAIDFASPGRSLPPPPPRDRRHPTACHQRRDRCIYVNGAGAVGWGQWAARLKWAVNGVTSTDVRERAMRECKRRVSRPMTDRSGCARQRHQSINVIGIGLVFPRQSIVSLYVVIFHRSAIDAQIHSFIHQVHQVHQVEYWGRWLIINIG